MNTFTKTELQNILTEIEQQLQELKHMDYAPKRGDELPSKQQQAIEQATSEDMPSFWQRFRHAARKDLCEEGGVLYEQWKKWGDLNNEAVVRTFAAVLITMGFAGSDLQVLVVALVVLVLHIGIEAVCAGNLSSTAD